MFGKLSSRYKQWKNERKERKPEALMARAADLDESQEHDLVFLQDQGFVRARATGQSIQQVYGEIENLIRKKLQVVIKPGTYFVARGNYQNMVTRTEHRLTLPPGATSSVAISAACINAERPIPGKRDRFYGVKRVPDDVARFLAASQKADPMAVQAGIWALTNGYSGADVQRTLVMRDRYGNSRQAVSDAHLAEARRILDQLGIRHRL